MKLWSTQTINNSSVLEQKIEQFTIGSDPIWDIYLAKAEIEGSLAHAEMLKGINLLTQSEFESLQTGLVEILETIENGTFKLEQGVEDIHSQIELLLTRSKGEVGKKIHSGRSRNDQSLLDIKLFLRSEIKSIASLTETLFRQLQQLSEANKEHFLPGYTHMQLAMPSSFGLWFGAYAESLSDDLELLTAAYKLVNKNPLGSGAGYGSSFPLNRSKTTSLLHFDSMNYNVVYAQMTRGKSEKVTAVGLASLASTLSRFAMDVCLYMNQNFGFVSFPKELTTGSSIMPHKKNPDVFELIRAKCNRIQALPNELTLLCNNLPSGYHRDLQLTKECLFPALIDLKDCLELATMMLQHIEINTDLLSNKQYENLFTVEALNLLVLEGVPFREAYQIVAQQLEENTFEAKVILTHTHEGSMGNLCNDKIKNEFEKKMKTFKC